MREVLYSAKKMDLSLDKSTADVWKRDESIQAGDTITVGVDDMRIVDTTYVYTQQTQQVKVGAVIRYFPDQGVWPFSGDVQSHVVIGSRKLMASMYGDGFTTYENEDMEWMDARISAFNLTSYGRAYYSLYAEQDAAMETTLSPVIRVAREFSMILRNNKDANQAVYDKALSSCLLVGTLAFAATLIVWMILSNTLASAQEQGRKRTGILQALGITRGQLIRSQAAQAVGYWLVTVVAANTLLAAVVLISGAVQRSGQGLGLIQLAQMILREDLVGYPWLLHGVLCLLELPVLLIFHLRAVRIPLKYSPVENIRS